jgi:tight adherence protein B
MSIASRLGLVALAAAALAGAASGATSPKQLHLVEAGGTTFPAKSYILTLPSPKALSNSDVSVNENGQRVPGVSVVRQGTAKAASAVVLAIDESLTMEGKPSAAAFAAARAFAKSANPNESIAVVTFNGDVKVLQPFTTSAADINKALAKPPDFKYGTKVYDALEQSLDLIKSAGAPTASVIVLTDGQNVGSKTSASTARDDLKKAHVRAFAVGLRSPAYNAAALRRTASTTGGSYVEANSPSDLQPLLVKLGNRLSSEYLVNYTSYANPSTKVVVAVSVKGFPRPARTAYTTPALHIVPAPPYKPSSVNSVIQSRWVLFLVALLFAALIGFGVIIGTSKKPEALVDRVGGFVSTSPRGSAAAEPATTKSPSLVSRVTARASRSGWWDRLEETLELADIKASPLQFVTVTALVTLLAVLILGVTVGLIGILFAAVTPLLVRALVLHRVSRKRKAFAEQLPDNLEVLASALRSGHSLVGAMRVVADDAVEPSKAEFQRILADEQLGIQLEDAIKVVVGRMDNKDLDQVALVARLQREMGSNSAEVLDRVVETVRARMELRRLIRSLTAQGRMSRWVLTLLPIGLAVVITLLSSTYMHPLFYTTLGRILLVLAAICVALGSWIIGKIVDIRLA